MSKTRGTSRARLRQLVSSSCAPTDARHSSRTLRFRLFSSNKVDKYRVCCARATSSTIHAHTNPCISRLSPPGYSIRPQQFATGSGRTDRWERHARTHEQSVPFAKHSSSSERAPTLTATGNNNPPKSNKTHDSCHRPIRVFFY